MSILSSHYDTGNKYWFPVILERRTLMKTILYLAALVTSVAAGVTSDADLAPVLLVWAMTLMGLGLLCAVPERPSSAQEQS